MNHDPQVLHLIERALESQPFCICDRSTTITWRDGGVWLDCSLLLEAPKGLPNRVARFLSDHVHTHVRIADVRPAAQERAAAAGS